VPDELVLEPVVDVLAADVAAELEAAAELAAPELLATAGAPLVVVVEPPPLVVVLEDETVAQPPTPVVGPEVGLPPTPTEVGASPSAVLPPVSLAEPPDEVSRTGASPVTHAAKPTIPAQISMPAVPA